MQNAENVKRSFQQPAALTKHKLRPLESLGMVHLMNGHFGIQKIGNGQNKTAINKEIYMRWPIREFNKRFNFTKWRRQHERKIRSKTIDEFHGKDIEISVDSVLRWKNYKEPIYRNLKIHH